METLISFSSRTWYPPTLTKVPIHGSMTMVSLLDWPANSPDLNLKDNLWGIVKRKMRDTRPNNAGELKQAGLPLHLIRLIASMVRCIDAVVDAKGAPTKYMDILFSVLLLPVIITNA